MSHVNLLTTSQDRFRFRIVDTYYDVANDVWIEAPVDLTGATSLQLVYSVNGGAEVVKTAVADADQVGNIGFAYYDLLAGDLTVAGEMIFRARWTDTAAKAHQTETSRAEISSHTLP